MYLFDNIDILMLFTFKKIFVNLNRAYKELCSIEAWENNVKTSLELDLKKMEVYIYYYIVSIHDEFKQIIRNCILLFQILQK